MLKGRQTQRTVVKTQTELVLKADKKLRRTALVLILLGCIIGGAGVVYFRDLMAQVNLIDDKNPVAALEILLRFMDRIYILFMILTVPAVFAGVSMFRTSYLAYKTERFPPVGTRVIKDTKLYVGKAAKRRGIVGMVFSIVAISGIMLITVFLYWVLNIMIPNLT